MIDQSKKPFSLGIGLDISRHMKFRTLPLKRKFVYKENEREKKSKVATSHPTAAELEGITIEINLLKI